MTPIKSRNTESSEELLPCPGKRLQMAREAKGMDLVQAAEQLHLSRAMVNALEAEDYDRLPARVFVRGYYKNYARLVEVPEELILQEFEDRCPDKECRAAPPVTARRAKPEVHSSHRLVRLVTWLVIITMVAMLVVWSQGYFNWTQAPLAPEQARADKEQDASAVADIAEESNAATEEMVEDVIPPMLEPLPQPATEPAPAPQTVDGSSAVAPDSAVAPEAEPQLKPEPEPVLPPVVAEISVPVKPELTVMFSGDCWVDIRDSTRQFKLFGKMSNGDMRKLGGEPPYSMVFGNYPVAKLLVDGKPYDLGAHANGNTAKFTFDPSAAER